MVPNAVRNWIWYRPLLSCWPPQSAQHSCRARKLAAWVVITRSWMPASIPLASARDRPIASSRPSALLSCRISSSLITLLSSATIRSGIWIRMLVPKAAFRKDQPIRRNRRRPHPTSHALTCSRPRRPSSSRGASAGGCGGDGRRWPCAAWGRPEWERDRRLTPTLPARQLRPFVQQAELRDTPVYLPVAPNSHTLLDAAIEGILEVKDGLSRICAPGR